MALPEEGHESSNKTEVQICCAPQCWRGPYSPQLFAAVSRAPEGPLRSSEIKNKAAISTSTQETITLQS